MINKAASMPKVLILACHLIHAEVIELANIIVKSRPTIFHHIFTGAILVILDRTRAKSVSSLE